MKFLNISKENMPKAVLTAAALLAALVLPLIFSSRYYLIILTNILLFSICAESLNLLLGYTGQISLGHGAFFMVGAYTFSILTKSYAVNQWLAILGSIVICILLGLLLGIPSCKVSAIYLAMVTAGFASVITLFVTNEAWLTNGPNGITGVSRPVIFGHKLTTLEFYYFCLLVLILVIIMVRNIVNSRTGRALMAVRGNTIAAAAMGVNVNHYKLMVFAVTSALAGLAGALYSMDMGMTGPSLFGTHSFLFLTSTIVGGMGSLAGPIVGAALVTMLPEWLRFAQTYMNGLYGIMIALVILFLPKGIYGGIESLLNKYSASGSFSLKKKGGNENG